MGYRKLAALLALLLASGARASQVDFDDIASGTLLDDEWTSASNPNVASGEGFTITTTNNAGPDWATLYDTELTGGEDDDLEGPPGTNWAGGNLSSPQTSVGNVVIIQEQVSAAEQAAGQLALPSGQTSGSNHAPDDDANGGTISFQFESPLESLGFIWVDLDAGQVPNYSIDFIDNASGTSVSLPMAFFESPLSGFYDATVDWADSHANLVDLITADALAAEFGVPITQFDQVDFNMSGSGGIAYLRYELVDAPEPGTLPMVAIGLAWLANQRRRT